MNTHVLVIGANGFLGRHVVQKCRMNGWSVLSVYHRKRENLAPDIPSLSIDQLLKWGVKERDSIDIVFLLAAQIPYPGISISELEMKRSSLELPVKIHTLFPRAKIVFSSSVSVYEGVNVSPITERTTEKPTVEYGKNKFFAEQIISSHKSFAIVRFSSLYGVGMYLGTFLPKIIDDARRKHRIVLLGDGMRRQDYLHVTDAANLCVLASQGPNGGKYLGVLGVSHTNTYIATLVAKQISGTRITYAGSDATKSFDYDNSDTCKILLFFPKVTIGDGIHELIHAT